MIRRWLRLMHGDQRGFTILELVLVMLVATVIAGAATATIFQVMKGSGTSNKRALALSNVQSAARWFTLDALQAQGRPLQGTEEKQIPAIVGEPVVTLEWPITLNWKDYSDNTTYTTYQSVYSYSSTNKTITRRYSVNATQPSEFISTTTVAQFIDLVPNLTTVNYDWPNEMIMLTVTATVGSGSSQVSENRTYQIISRWWL